MTSDSKRGKAMSDETKTSSYIDPVMRLPEEVSWKRVVQVKTRQQRDI